ncbi:hypothetical protein HK096_005695, partial [Nowakowskiella sp. JEL0078]
MGAKTSKLTSEEISDLLNRTHFDRKELQQWYKSFQRDCPKGSISRPEFQKIYRQFFPFGDPTQFADLVFDVFDANSNGIIEFSEFIIALSVNTRGRAFKLYDIDKDGFITKKEMFTLIDSIYKMIGSTANLPMDEDTPQKR